MLLIGQLAKRNPDHQGGEQVRIYARGSAGRTTQPRPLGSGASAALVALAIALIVILAGCGKKEAGSRRRPKPPTPVTVEAAVRGADRSDRDPADAVLYPMNQANVTPRSARR